MLVASIKKKKVSVLIFFGKKLIGPTFFREIMSSDRYKEIRKFLRFDVKSARSQKINTDKFTHVREKFLKLY